jgi:hypothetical protein
MEKTMSKSNTKKAPWHLWTVGIIGLLWNAIGAIDFVMTQIKYDAYMSEFTPQQLEYFYSFPMWLVVCWAIAVWGGVIGCLLLLMRKTLAVWVFFASFITMLITTFHNFVLSNALEVIGDTFSLIFTGVIFIAAFAIYLYSRRMQQKNFLN